MIAHASYTTCIPIFPWSLEGDELGRDHLVKFAILRVVVVKVFILVEVFGI
jgi:hypothetical protein